MFLSYYFETTTYGNKVDTLADFKIKIEYEYREPICV